MDTVQTFPTRSQLQVQRPRFYENVLQTIGQTPLVKLNRIVAEACMCTVWKSVV